MRKHNVKLSKERIYSTLVGTHWKCHLLDKHQQLVRSYLHNLLYHFLMMINLMMIMIRFNCLAIVYNSKYSQVWWSVKHLINHEKFFLIHISSRMVHGKYILKRKCPRHYNGSALVNVCVLVVVDTLSCLLYNHQWHNFEAILQHFQWKGVASLVWIRQLLVVR